MYNVFGSLEEAQEAEAKDALKSGHRHWAKIYKLNSGHYIYTLYPDSDFSYDTYEVQNLEEEMDTDFVLMSEESRQKGSATKISKPVTGKWFISYNNAPPPESFGYVGPDVEMVSGYKTIECFDNEEDYLVRIGELGITIDMDEDT